MAKEYLQKLTDLLERVFCDEKSPIKLECRHFFSGAALYVEGKMCLSLTPVGLAMKLPSPLREELLKNKMAIPLQYFPNGPIKKEYVLFSGEQERHEWIIHKHVKVSIGYVLSLHEVN